ncbi:hypothetical protein [Limnofasciculus baicalensis]|nr:hypothetical protein [Limnofasciculus baicalensis]
MIGGWDGLRKLSIFSADIHLLAQTAQQLYTLAKYRELEETAEFRSLFP